MRTTSVAVISLLFAAPSHAVVGYEEVGELPSSFAEEDAEQEEMGLMQSVAPMLKALDQNQDGLLSKNELFAPGKDGVHPPKDLMDLFDRALPDMDLDKDGLLSPEEFPAMMNRLAGSSGQENQAGLLQEGEVETEVDNDEDYDEDEDGEEDYDQTDEAEPPSSVLEGEEEEEAQSEQEAGVVSALMAALGPLDRNKDGKLSKDELFNAGKDGVAAPAEALAIFERVMPDADTDKDGLLSPEEMPVMMEALQHLGSQQSMLLEQESSEEPSSMAEATDSSRQSVEQELFGSLASVDVDHDGKLSKDEIFAPSAKGEEPPADLMEAFDKAMPEVDKDGDGLLSHAEMPFMMNALGHHQKQVSHRH